MHGVLCVGIWCAIKLISLLFAAVLRLGIASLSPLGILHMAALVTLCEAYIRIEPYFNLWNYFFRARLL
jgi:hypothetical protein